MTTRSTRCPNCSAPITFRWASAVQTTCPHCRSVVVRHDVDLRAIGEVSTLPDDSSPIQLGAEGRFEDRPFTVVGRIVYEHDGGGWNEWHIVFADNSSAWLSDALAEYAVSRLVAAPAGVPAVDTLTIGRGLVVGDARLVVSSITRARYAGVEGELPFEYWGRDDITFVDLRSEDGRFATIDGSETPPLLFAGRFVEYDQLGLKGCREFEGW